jgi:DNA-binding response OmpR family regulator
MKTILLIDDDIRVSGLLKRFLYEAKYNVMEANGGVEGVRMAQESKPDIILCDIMMPEMDGFAVLKEIRGSSTTKTIPFIFLTAKDGTSDFLTGISKGADGYLSKPISREDLVETIETHTM